MTTCHHCGQDMPVTLEWQGLRVTSFGSVYWRGIKVDVTPMQARILYALARRGEATHLSLEMMTASERGSSVKVHVHHLRRKLPGLRIASVRDVGYRLETVN